MQAPPYRPVTIQNLALAKLFAIAALLSRFHPGTGVVFEAWNGVLAIVFSFAALAIWMYTRW